MKVLAALLLSSLLLAAGCTPYRYHAAPLSAPGLAQALQNRSLDDPDLRLWMKQAAGYRLPDWPIRSWDLTALTLAGWYFNPDLDLARADAAATQAAVATAAMKPNPTIGAGSGYETAPESPYLFTVDFSLPIETAGKRGYRIAAASHWSDAGRLQVAEAAWSIRSRIRIALLNYSFAAELAAILRRQETLQSGIADGIDARVRAGEVPLSDATAARIDLSATRQSLRAAEGQISTARAAMAAAIGIPPAALSGKALVWPGEEEPPAPASLPPRSVRDSAMKNRLDVEQALARYEAAQSNLQLEVAQQYPDIDIGPGYAYEEGYHLISLGLSAVLPVRNRNEGPILEAEARRKAAGADLLAVQSAVMADTGRALASYLSTYATFKVAEQSVSLAEAQRTAASQLFGAGESDRSAALTAQIQVFTAERARLDALYQTQLSLGLLEDALQRPISPASTPILPSQAPR